MVLSDELRCHVRCTCVTLLCCQSRSLTHNLSIILYFELKKNVNKKKINKNLFDELYIREQRKKNYFHVPNLYWLWDIQLVGNDQGFADLGPQQYQLIVPVALLT